MKNFLSSLNLPKNKIAHLAASVVATVALTGLVNSAHASVKVLPEPEINPVSIQTSPTQPIVTNSITKKIEYQAMGVSPGTLFAIVLVGGVIVFVPLFFGGLVVIGEREVGIVVRKFTFSGKGLPADRLIALNNEAGLQADTLAPGWHWGYWPWQYSVKKESVIVVPQGEIALIVAADGESNPPERILGKIVDCDNFQDARKFLTQGGEKGRQMGFLTAGTYRINTALFKVIMASNAATQGMTPEQLQVYSVASEKVGIVTTLDGLPIHGGEIAGAVITGS